MTVLRSERVEGDELARLVALKASADEAGWRRYSEYGPPEGNVEWRRLGTFPGTGVFCGSFKGAVAALGDPMLLEWRYLSGVEGAVTGEGMRVWAPADGGRWEKSMAEFQEAEARRAAAAAELARLDDAAAPAAPEAPLSMLADSEALLSKCLDLTGRISAWTAAMDGRGTGSGEVASQEGRAARLWLGLVALRDRLRDVADRLDRL